MESICDIIFNAIYLILSITILFAQLVVLIPACLRWFPYYKKSMYALDKIFQLDEEGEFSYPDTLIRGGEGGRIEGEKVKLNVGYIRKGERGFKELLEAIKENRPVPNVKTETIGLAFGDIPISTSMASPNFALFDKDIGISKPIYFDPWCYDEPSYIRAIFQDWVIKRAQTRIAKYTAIIITMWIVVSIYLIFIK